MRLREELSIPAVVHHDAGQPPEEWQILEVSMLVVFMDSEGRDLQDGQGRERKHGHGTLHEVVGVCTTGVRRLPQQGLKLRLDEGVLTHRIRDHAGQPVRREGCQCG